MAVLLVIPGTTAAAGQRGAAELLGREGQMFRAGGPDAAAIATATRAPAHTAIAAATRPPGHGHRFGPEFVHAWRAASVGATT